jgi:sec-independent protein translocase protein TatC
VTGRLRSLDAQGRATTINHLEELRWRIIACIGWFCVLFCVAYGFHGTLLSILGRPLGHRYQLITLGVTEPFFTLVTVAANAAFVAVAPIITYNAWRFVAPAMAPHQRRAVRLLVVAAPAMFCAGVVFCYFLILPAAVDFLLGLGAGNFHVTVRASDYYSFVSMLSLAMGLIFLFPLALLALARLGLVTTQILRKQRRLAFLLIAVLAALLPTVDPVSLVLEMLPMLALYELSILLVSVQERALRRAEARGVVEG